MDGLTSMVKEFKSRFIPVKSYKEIPIILSKILKKPY